MNNPYQAPENSPENSPEESGPSPLWYHVFYRIYGPVWWAGTGLIAASWLGFASVNLGWIGFFLAAAATVGAYVLPTLAGVQHERYVILDSRHLRLRGESYREVMANFIGGATLMHDGVAFAFRAPNVIACGIVANTEQLEDAVATEFAEHAKAVFDQLSSECPEFAEAVDGRSLRISILSGFDEKARELCRIVDGHFDWSP